MKRIAAHGFDSSADQHNFQRLGEGSEFIPVRLARALVSERTGRPFFEMPERFGMIAGDGPGSLPVGLVEGPNAYPSLQFLGPAAGFNCAACHSAEIRYNGKSILVNGAPGRTDFSGFQEDLVESAKATLRSPKKLSQFISRLSKEAKLSASVRADTKSAGAVEAHLADRGLQSSLDAFARSTAAKAPAGAMAEPAADIAEATPADASLQHYMKSVRALGEVLGHSQDIAGADDAPMRFDFGRVDAFGSARKLIFPGNPPHPDIVPVNYPPIWDFGKEPWLHYDGNTRSVLARNVGQVIGLKARFNPNTFETSVNLKNVHRLERIARKINPPRWPAILPKIDGDLAAQGQPLYQTHCANCHDRRDEHGDAMMFTAKELGVTGGRLVQFGEKLIKGPFKGQDYSKGLELALGKVMDKARVQQGIDPNLWDEMFDGRPNEWRTTNMYAARSLHGVWATAPYLHNGSVPTLDDLLQPEAKRPKKFYTDNRTYDPKKVGYSTEAASNQSKPFVVNGGINSNRGHLYGTTLLDPERLALLEYLKTL